MNVTIRNGCDILHTNEIKYPYNNNIRYEHHWLPSQFPVVDSDESALGSTKLEDYKEFDHLVHATHVKSALQAWEDAKLKANQTVDSSLLKNHNGGINTVWVAPNTAVSDRYGPVVFHFPMSGNEGIIRWTSKENDWKYYWVEVIDYHVNQSASRILVTRKDYSNIYRVYNPTIRGGPWYWDEKHDKHYWLPKSRAGTSHGASSRNHALEFVREEPFNIPADLIDVSFVDHRDCKRHKKSCNDLKTLQVNQCIFLFTLVLQNLKQCKHGQLQTSCDEILDIIADKWEEGDQTCNDTEFPIFFDVLCYGLSVHGPSAIDSLNLRLSVPFDKFLHELCKRLACKSLKLSPHKRQKLSPS